MFIKVITENLPNNYKMLNVGNSLNVVTHPKGAALLCLLVKYIAFISQSSIFVCMSLSK